MVSQKRKRNSPPQGSLFLHPVVYDAFAIMMILERRWALSPTFPGDIALSK
jgi:hypothetical protein